MTKAHRDATILRSQAFPVQGIPFCRSGGNFKLCLSRVIIEIPSTLIREGTEIKPEKTEKEFHSKIGRNAVPEKVLQLIFGVSGLTPYYPFRGRASATGV